MRTLFLLLLATALPLGAALTRVRLQLPPGVAFQHLSEEKGRVEIRLSLSALESGVQASGPVTIRQSGDACVVSIPGTPGELPALSRQNVADGPVLIELVETAAAPVASNPVPPQKGREPPAPATAPTPSSGANPAGTPATEAAAGEEAPPAKSSKMDDLIAKALAGLPDAVKFDPVAMADYAIPASAAATVIGSGSTLTRPGTPREVVTSLLSDFDKDGRLQTGFSFAFTPYTLLRKMPLSAREYQEDSQKRFLANLQVSLAARTDEDIVTSGQKAARFGAGLTMVFFDKGDLRLDNNFLTTLTAGLAKGVGFGAEDVTGDLDKVKGTPAALLKAAGKAWTKRQAELWNASSAGLGVAPAFLSLTGKLADARDDGFMTWINYSRPGPGSLAESTQLVLGGNGRFRQRVQVNSGWTRADVIDFGAQFRYGGQAGNFFAEAQYRRRDGGAGDTEKFVYELGVERRIADGVWLNLSWTNDDAVEGGKLIRTGLRYGFGSKAVLSPLKN